MAASIASGVRRAYAAQDEATTARWADALNRAHGNASTLKQIAIKLIDALAAERKENARLRRVIAGQQAALDSVRNQRTAA